MARTALGFVTDLALQRRTVEFIGGSVRAGDPLVVTAADRGAEPLDILLLGELSIGAPVAHYGPSVMNTRAEILQAVEDYQAGRLGIIPADQLARRDFA